MNCQSEGHWAILMTMVFEGVGGGLLEPELLKTFLCREYGIDRGTI